MLWIDHKLKILGCSSNFLTNLDLTNNLQLESLDLADNNFPERDLIFLDNLRNLAIGNNDERKNSEIRNRFTGSLVCLEEMKKLERYSETNLKIIESELSNDEKITCHFNTRINVQAKNIWSLDVFENKLKGNSENLSNPWELFKKNTFISLC